MSRSRQRRTDLWGEVKSERWCAGLRGRKGGYGELREFKEIKEFRDYVLRIIDDSAFLKLSNFPKLTKLPISALSSLSFIPAPAHLNQRTNFLLEGVRLGLSQKKIPSG